MHGPPARRWLRRLRACGVALVGAVLSLLFLEGGARLVAQHVLLHGRLFRSDPVLGWRPLASLTQTRRNADGALWEVRTNEEGFRGPAAWDPSARLRILVLGDSFAFGEGVDLEERFDRLLVRAIPGVSAVNLGVPGYGTGQQLIAARPYLARLRPGDVIVLLTSSGDFADLLASTHAGRPKPWFSLEGGRLHAHPPVGGWLASLRERSYLLAQTLRILKVRQGLQGPADVLGKGWALYAALVQQELGPAAAEGVRVVVAHHSAGAGPPDRELARRFQALCARKGFADLDLDPVVPEPSGFLADYHWSREGHRAAAEALLELIPRPAGAAGSEARPVAASRSRPYSPQREGSATMSQSTSSAPVSFRKGE